MPPAPGDGRKRADAARNRKAIVEAAIRALARDPYATMSEIAQEAGLGRVTLYGHFSSKPELLEEVVQQVLHQGDEALAAVDWNGDPREALTRLIEKSWDLVWRARAVIAAAERDLPAGHVRQLHDEPAARVHTVIARGKKEGAFSTGLPTSWLVAVVHQVLHGATVEIENGRLHPARARTLITKTVFDLLDAAPT